MENNDYDYNQFELPKERPIFLTILCVLTYIVSGITIISSLFNLVFSSPEQQIEEVNRQLENLEEGGMMYNMLEASLVTLPYITELSIAGILGGIICIFGAMKMWNFKKTGFFIYSAGAMISPVVTLALLGGEMGISSFLGASVFIGLYALNLKHLED